MEEHVVENNRSEHVVEKCCKLCKILRSCNPKPDQTQLFITNLHNGKNPNSPSIRAMELINYYNKCVYPLNNRHRESDGYKPYPKITEEDIIYHISKCNTSTDQMIYGNLQYLARRTRRLEGKLDKLDDQDDKNEGREEDEENKTEPKEENKYSKSSEIHGQLMGMYSMMLRLADYFEKKNKKKY